MEVLVSGDNSTEIVQLLDKIISLVSNNQNYKFYADKLVKICSKFIEKNSLYFMTMYDFIKLYLDNVVSEI